MPLCCVLFFNIHSASVSLTELLKKQPNLLDYIDEKVNEGDIIAFIITLEIFKLLKRVYKRSNV